MPSPRRSEKLPVNCLRSWLLERSMPTLLMISMLVCMPSTVPLVRSAPPTKTLSTWYSVLAFATMLSSIPKILLSRFSTAARLLTLLRVLCSNSLIPTPLSTIFAQTSKKLAAFPSALPLNGWLPFTRCRLVDIVLSSRVPLNVFLRDAPSMELTNPSLPRSFLKSRMPMPRLPRMESVCWPSPSFCFLMSPMDSSFRLMPRRVMDSTSPSKTLDLLVCFLLKILLVMRSHLLWDAAMRLVSLSSWLPEIIP
mmetsp:Transcript_6695/g.10975  ORF Transcript_6695/g.10975 Transcript_6695/m.10975 type:complete len:252 (+) Transcript_6695:1298-2053(+)